MIVLQKRESPAATGQFAEKKADAAIIGQAMPALQVVERSDGPRVDSRLLAQHMGFQHRSTFKLISEHRHDFEQFGKVRFEIAALPGSATRQKERFALLNEDQAYLLLTYSRNTAGVRRLKINLVRAFGQTRRAAQQRHEEYLPTYHTAHDALKGLGRDQAHQRHLHLNVNRLLNRVAGIERGQRSQAQQTSLSMLTVGQMLAAKAAAGACDDKDAYARIKNALTSLQTMCLERVVA